MDKKEKIAYWVDIADYDFETAHAMLQSNRYLYVVFMCQQAMEKIIKGVYIDRFDEEPPRSHNLSFVFQKLSLDAPEGTLHHLNLLSAYYIESRYPEYKSRLSTIVDKEKADVYFKKTEEIYTWLRSLLT